MVDWSGEGRKVLGGLKQRIHWHNPQGLARAALIATIAALFLHAFEISTMTHGRDAYVLSRFELWHILIVWLSRLSWAVAIVGAVRVAYLWRQSGELLALVASYGRFSRRLAAIAVAWVLIHVLHVVLRKLQWISSTYDVLRDDLSIPIVAIVYATGTVASIVTIYVVVSTWLERYGREGSSASNFVRWALVGIGVLLWLSYLNVLVYHAAGQPLW